MLINPTAAGLPMAAPYVARDFPISNEVASYASAIARYQGLSGSCSSSFPPAFLLLELPLAPAVLPIRLAVAV